MKGIVFVCWCWVLVIIIQPSYMPAAQLSTMVAFIGLSTAVLLLFGKNN